MFNRRIVNLFLLILLLITIGFLASLKRINKEFPAVKYRLGDEETFENITIKINGVYQRRLFFSDVFKGSIYIEGYEFTGTTSASINSVILSDIYFEKDGSGWYRYLKTDNGELQKLMMGTIYMDDNFSRVALTVHDDSVDSSVTGWSIENGLIIAAPAKTKEEAVKISNQLLRLDFR